MSTKNFEIATPHAAVIVWNYNDRISGNIDGDIDEEGIDFTLISTVSCVSIQTSKSKNSPAGSFQLVLSPFKNWISTLTTGSWCAILMSNKPITEANINLADAEQVKMFGKIETVRVETSVAPDGARTTRFLVSGTDWGHIFNNTLYIDNNITSPNEPQGLGNPLAIALRNALLGENNSPKSYSVKDNLTLLINIFGSDLTEFTKQGKEINRLAKSTYDLTLPTPVAKFFSFVDPTEIDDFRIPTANSTASPAKGYSESFGNTAPKKAGKSRVVTKLLKIQTGKLNGKRGIYDETPEAFGIINPFSLQGTNSFWQVLLDNSNPSLNEMYNEINWTENGPQLTLYNRIKPFSYKTSTVNGLDNAKSIRSLFTHVKTHKINKVAVISANIGTNWRDKYNFIEVKPQFGEFRIYDNWVKQKSQLSDPAAFNREGFRPLIVNTKQFPVAPTEGGAAFSPDQLAAWTQLLSEWYFDTHRLLNGTLNIVGQNEYIAVGNNIRFSADLINATPNINSKSSKNKKNYYILGHVENVSHTFSIKEDGAREYRTTVQFVRGIIVNEQHTLVGEGSLDLDAEDMTPTEDRNSKNTVSTSEKDDPDPKDKVYGT